MQAGDQLEVRGPIGGWFVWPGDTPALLLSGGRSALFPMIAMLRLARRTGASDLIRLVVCVGSPEGLYFSGELPGPETSIVYTNRAPDTAGRPPGRLKKHDVPIMPTGALAFICGSSSFTDRATELVMRTGIPVGQIGRTGSLRQAVTSHSSRPGAQNGLSASVMIESGALFC